jgi:two-component system OmpR family sensor kinase
MSISGESRGFWTSVRRLPGRTPLRVKLITAVLTLVAIALLVISVAGLAFLRNYLLVQADNTLAANSNQTFIQSVFHTYEFQGGTFALNSGAVDWIPDGGKVQHIALEMAKGSGLNAPGSGSSSHSVKPGPAVTPGATWLSGGEYVTVRATSGPGRYRVIALPNQPGPGANGPTAGTLIIAIDVTSVYHTLGKLTTADIIISGILLVGLAVIGVAVIQTSLKPLTDIEQTADAIARGDLSRRVPERDPRTEIGRLGRSLNAMLAQIETAFHARSASERAARRSEDRMRQFVADASHELRTPLTAIRGFAEYYRQRGGVDLAGPAASTQTALPPSSDSPGGGMSNGGVPNGAGPNGLAPNGDGSGPLAPADLDRIMRRVEQESSRMGILVEDMLLLARLDQQRPLEHRTVDLLTLAADAVHDARVVAPARSINLTVGAGAALLVLGDEVRLRQVIGNLMSNALAHTPDGSPIDVRIRSGSLTEAPSYAQARPPVPPPSMPALGAEPPDTAEQGTPPPGPVQPAATGPRSAAVLEVADHGPGLTREQAEHAFERFYRADQARTTGGTGLGLAIVAALVAAHGGAVWVESAPGQGATFRIALPLAPEALHDIEHDAEHDSEGAALGRGAHPGSEGEHGTGGG